MVCLEGMTLSRLEKSLSSVDLKRYPLWSWLSHLLTKYIYSLEHKKGNPAIPSENDRTLYALWFKDMEKEFLKEFDDATPERVYRSLLNPPCEKIAFMTYTATQLELQKGFLYSIRVYEPRPAPLFPPSSIKNMLNPAEVEGSDYESYPNASDSDDDSMPDLESQHDEDDEGYPELEDIGNIADDIPDLMDATSNSKILKWSGAFASNIKFCTTWDELLTSGPIFTVPPVQTNKLAKQVHQDAS